ncbi:four helix bundle protein [Candidatus Curtissbacteria bacterium]|nr:four helix bundle protein [Candidatus Curtissbacteria bacterium]
MISQNYNSKFKSDLRQRCFQFGLEVIRLTDKLPQKRSAWVISDQVIRSSCSIGANLVEAKGSSSRLEFKKFYEISLKSANESKYWIELLREAGLVPAKSTDALLSELQEITSMIASGVIKLKSKNF